jgi:hypothetical protein
MASQLNFYLPSEEQDTLIDNLLSEDDSYFCCELTTENVVCYGKERRLTELECYREGRLVKYYIGRRSIGDPIIATTKIGNIKYIDLEKSEVIEFFPCRFKNGTVFRGRLYYHNVYYYRDEKIEKSHNFLNWARKVLRKVRGTLIKHDAVSYVNVELAELSKRGHVRLML